MKIILLKLSTLLLLSSVAYSGSYGMQSVSTFADWEPSECSKPYPPSFYVTDASSYNMAVDNYNSYIQQIEYYLECIKREGEGDAQAIICSIDEGISRAEDEIVNDLQRVRSDLESSKMLIN